MILPILISVSLAPGSYFFCASAGLAIAAAIAKSVKAVKWRVRTGIIPLPLGQLFFASLASRAHACKHPLIPRDETIDGWGGYLPACFGRDTISIILPSS